jgi:zinc transport system permease protein
MLDDFLFRALLGGLGVAIVSGPLGCFVVWRRLAYFGDTLSHSALLGVALAILLEVNIMLAVFVISVLMGLALIMLRQIAPLSSDALLGLLAHSTLALGLIALSFMTWVRVDLLGFLFGDVLAVNQFDLLTIGLGGTVVLLVLRVIWRPLFAATVSPEIARAEGLQPERAELIFMILMASVIAISMKIVGVLLITAMLIIPAASARCFSKSPEQMALYSVLVGTLAVVAGLQSSLIWDTPAGPSIVAALLLVFIVSTLLMAKIRDMKHQRRSGASTEATT